jgi:UMF1 family MFS transporter
MSLDGDGDATDNNNDTIRYEGEDRRATTPRELNGWYAYPIASEVFAVVGVGT